VKYPVLPGLELGNLLQFLLTIPVLFRIGKPFHIAAYKALKHASANMDVLVSLGTNIAFFFSSAAMLHGIAVPDFTPSIFFETSSTLITFITLGRWMYVVVIN
jgi:Cu+-exporting ATPase